MNETNFAIEPTLETELWLFYWTNDLASPLMIKAKDPLVYIEDHLEELRELCHKVLGREYLDYDFNHWGDCVYVYPIVNVIGGEHWYVTVYSDQIIAHSNFDFPWDQVPEEPGLEIEEIIAANNPNNLPVQIHVCYSFRLNR